MILVQWCCDRSIVERALANAHPQTVRNQWVRPGDKDVVQFPARLPADDENILESFRCEEGGTRALALEQGVRRHSGSMNDFRSGRAAGSRHSLHDGFLRLLRCREFFEYFDLAVADNHEVRECPAGIDADSKNRFARHLERISGGWFRSPGSFLEDRAPM